MKVCQTLNGSGGWPLTIFMTPDKKPFFAGTYFPPESNYGRIGLIDLIENISNIWINKRDMLYSTTDEIFNALNQSKKSHHDELSRKIFDDLFHHLEFHFDKKNGGFIPAPKFPSPHILMFLFRYSHAYNNETELSMAIETLKKMRMGGIFDQCGYGFHRYSTDGEWLVPHFEKMLYDQANLLSAYSEAFQITKAPLYKNTCLEIASYLKDNMLFELSDNVAAFYSAEDADSDGTEGKYYLWTQAEIQEILKKDSVLFIKLLKVMENGNCAIEPGVTNPKSNILHLTQVDDLTSNYEFILKCNKKLNTFRQKRTHPFKDKKVLTDWNGMMISALSKSGFILYNKELITLAERNAEFIVQYLLTGENQLKHRYIDGDIAVDGLLDDYAFFIQGLIDLYFATFKLKYLDLAIKLTSTTISKFYDETDGGFYQVEKKNNSGLLPNKEIYDGAYPAGNSVMLLNLIRLWKITGNQKLFNNAKYTISSFSTTLNQYPAGYSYFLSAVLWLFVESSETVITSVKSNPGIDKILDLFRKYFSPFNVLLMKTESKQFDGIAYWIDALEIDKEIPKIYFCKNSVCYLPVEKIDELENILNKRSTIDC